MSKTIRKISWAVPGLAMVAVAAFLAIGLLATHGVQPVAAQDADCTVEIAADGTVSATAACSVQGDMATVEFEGADLATEDRTLSLLIADPDGAITAYPNGTIWVDANSQLEDGSNNAASAMKYRYQSITVPKAAPNPTTGTVEGQSVSITVKGDVHIWAGTTSVTSAIGSIPAGDAASGAREIAASASELEITFLGAPAIGVDGDDANSIVDDTLESTTIPPFTDTTESRSMLVAVTGATTTTVIDGSSADHVLSGADAAVTITATVQDAAGNLLEGVEVTFTATSDPAGVESSTRVVDTIVAAGTASRTISGLPTDSGYRVSVAVSAEGVNLGSIVIARSGDLATFSALICAADGNNTDADDGCGAASRPQSVFGDVNDDFRIVTTAQDALGSAAAGVSVDSDEDADGITVDAFDTTTGVADGNIVAADAEGGRYTITLTATQGSGTSEIELMTTVEVTISGPLATYEVTGPDNIESGTSQTFTVMALDSLGNPAQFATGQQVTVDVFVEGSAKNSVTVFGVPAGGLDLADDGEASFRIRAASDAVDGEITIVVSGVATIDEATKTVTIGTAPVPDFSAPSTVAVAVDNAGVPTVTWTAGDSAASQVVIVVNAADDTDYCLGVVAGDASSHTCTDALTSGASYVVLVIALDGQGGYMLGNVAAHTAS